MELELSKQTGVDGLNIFEHTETAKFMSDFDMITKEGEKNPRIRESLFALFEGEKTYLRMLSNIQMIITPSKKWVTR